jgi:hypothetical protein
MSPVRAVLAWAIAVLTALTVVPALADEGMWPFDNVPTGAVRKAYGVTIDQAWLDHVRLSTIRLSSGCSASVVSGQALVLSNYHCVVDCVQSLSTPRSDLLLTGVQTAALADERPCPGLQAEILLGAADVTDRVRDEGSASVHARDQTLAEIERSGCHDDPALRCQVVSLYHGGQYMLYRYRKYADVRLVFAPEFEVGFFGGDPDNFNFPRYDLDVAFLRLYENDRPVAGAEHLTWNGAASRAGEPVFVSGSPGGTERDITVSQLEIQRDLVLPISQLQRAEERGRLIQFSAESDEHRRVATDALFSLENTYKVYYGRQFELNDPAFMAIKRRQEAELKAKVAADAELKRRIGDPWADMADAQASYAALYPRYRQLEAVAGNLSQLHGYARTLVRAAAERSKPADRRLRDFADARLPLIRKSVLDPRPIDPALEQLYLGFWLSKTREVLTADDPAVKALLGAESPDQLAQRLVSATRLADPAVRRALWDGGQAAIDASTDPLIRFVVANDGAARKARLAWEERVSGPEDEAAGRIAQARFAVHGRGLYPDATFTPRLSYGQVAGWTYHGDKVEPFTRLGGLFARATGADPYRLPPRWLAAGPRLDPRTVFDLTTTNDIIGGNSGSPLIDAQGAVIGVVFDGNIHSLGGDYLYDAAVNRAIAVSTAAVAEALSKVYGDTRILAELTGP